MPSISREELIQKFQTMVRERRPIIGGGAGIGLSAKCEEQGGIDLIVIYNSGRYRMAGRGSLAGLLAYGNANEIVVDMAKEVLPVVKNTPVLAGVNGTDPFLLFAPFFEELKRLGFSGVQNFPTVGLIDGVFRQDNIIPLCETNGIGPPVPDFLGVPRNIADKLLAGFPQARNHHKNDGKQEAKHQCGAEREAYGSGKLPGRFPEYPVPAALQRQLEQQ